MHEHATKVKGDYAPSILPSQVQAPLPPKRKIEEIEVPKPITNSYFKLHAYYAKTRHPVNFLLPLPDHQRKFDNAITFNKSAQMGQVYLRALNYSTISRLAQLLHDTD